MAISERDAILVEGEFGPGRKAMPCQAKPRGARAHKPVDPEKQFLKRRLRNAVEIMRRLAAEKESGADMRAALSKLRAKTFAAQLARLSGMGGQRSRHVTDAELDELADTLSWLDQFLPDGADQWVVLQWSRGVSFAEMAAIVEDSSKATMWRIFDAALDKMLKGMQAVQHKALETLKRNEV